MRETNIRMKKKTIAWICTVAVAILFIAALLVYQSNPYNKISRFERLVNRGKLKNMSLEIYYVSPGSVFYSPPGDIKTLISICTDPDAANRGDAHLKVSGKQLKEHADIIGKIKKEKLKPTDKEGSSNIRVYYVFKYHGLKLFEVTMWEEYNNTHFPDNATEVVYDSIPLIYVNGIRMEANAEVYRAIIPFVDEEMAKALEGLAAGVEANTRPQYSDNNN